MTPRPIVLSLLLFSGCTFTASGGSTGTQSDPHAQQVGAPRLGDPPAPPPTRRVIVIAGQELAIDAPVM